MLRKTTAFIIVAVTALILMQSVNAEAIVTKKADIDTTVITQRQAFVLKNFFGMVLWASAFTLLMLKAPLKNLLVKTWAVYAVGVYAQEFTYWRHAREEGTPWYHWLPSVVTVDPRLQNLGDLVMAVYQMVTLLFGHNALSQLITILLTIWFVYPIVWMISMGTSHKSFGDIWRECNFGVNLTNMFYYYGVFGIFILPFVLVFDFFIAFIAWVSQGGGGVGDTVRANLQIVYHF